MNIGVHELWFSPGIYPEEEVQDHMVILFLVFLRNLHTVDMAVPNLHSPQQCSCFSIPSPAMIAVDIFYAGHFDWCEVIHLWGQGHWQPKPQENITIILFFVTNFFHNKNSPYLLWKIQKTGDYQKINLHKPFKAARQYAWSYQLR